MTRARSLSALAFMLASLPVGTARPQECASAAVSRAPVRVEYDAARLGPARLSALLFEWSDIGALNARDATTGSVLWTFQAPEIATATRSTGLMTDIAVMRFDANNDGFIDASGGDRVWLYFGLKRAGAYYYALDVTDRTPRVLWVAGADAMSGLADAWSTPTIARVRIAGARQNGEHFVLVIGGGYGVDAGASSVGNRLFMLDAATGQVLWSAGNHLGADRVLTRMTHGFAARVAVLDTNGDGFADRLYGADTGGRLWRFDIWNGRAPTELVTGGLLASLGIAEPAAAGVSPSDARRFFNAPDVALIQPRGGNAFFNLAIGSGDGDKVLTIGIRDRFYSVRDREPFVKRTQAACDTARVIFDADLTDISASPQSATVPDDSPGWKLGLISNGDASGEKVLAESLTAAGVILFTTHQPANDPDPAGCPQPGTNRVYAVRVESGAAALDLNGNLEVTPEDRFETLAQEAIAGEPRIEWVRPDGSGAPGSPTAPADNSPRPAARCLVGTELMSACVRFGTVLRTFWKRNSAN